MATANMEGTPIGADAKLRVTVETAAQPVSVGTTKMMGQSTGKENDQTSFKEILSSLAETRKYLPSQVYTFLDSMEGKTLDDLRVEAMHLANKAQEEAKKRAGDVTNYGKSMIDNANQKVNDVTNLGKSVVDNANQKVSDVTNMAKSRTSDLAHKGLDVVQPPIDRTKEATKSLAMKGLEQSVNLAMKGWDITNQTIIPRVQPYVTPYAMRVREYLPPTAKEFLKQNVDGKSLDELRNTALSATRKNLLSAKDEKAPSILGLAGEVKDATLSGALFSNSFQLAEKAANSAFGETESPKDASALRRMYNLSTKVTGGVRNYANSKFNEATGQVLDMTSRRVGQVRGMAMQRVDQMKQTMMPVAERVGSLPVIPDFVFRMLRAGSSPSGSMPQPSSGLETETKQKTTSTTATTVPTTTVKIDIVGVQPKETPKTTTTSGPADSSASVGSTTSVELKGTGKTSTETTIDNTNAQGKGDLGSKGMGVTTTGSESKQTPPVGTQTQGNKVDWPAGMTGAPEIQGTSETEFDTEENKSGKKKKQHHRM